ncbi:MAG: TPR repeat-containing protein YrrB [Bacteroidetes bacterium ADurb.Bin408]|nr:MAG: TPR repeat-containing protein YrrB [Bacteroidetes bacterium ADurb.Bin408]
MNKKKLSLKTHEKQWHNTAGGSKELHFTKKSQKKQAFLTNYGGILLIIIVTLLIYSRAFFNDFVFWDDDSYIHNNPYIKSLSIDNLYRIFTTPYFANYHPLTTLSYAIEYHFFGLNPLPYHITNVIIHLISTWLIYVFILRLCGQKVTALTVAFIFALHPMHVESVAWISERKDVMYTMFFIAGMNNYLKYLRNSKRIEALFVAFLFFTASVMSKSAAVVFPPVMVLIAYYIKKKLPLRDWLILIPFFIVSLFFGILALNTQHDAMGADKLNSMYTLIEKIVLVCYGTFFYIIRFIIPYGFSTFHPYPVAVSGSLPFIYYTAPIVLLSLVAGIFFLKKENKRQVVFGILFFILTIILVLQLIPIGDAMVSERYTYLPYTGLAFIAGSFLSKMSIRQNTLLSLGLLLYSLFLTVTTFIQIGVWKDSEHLWTKAIASYPESYIAYHNRGNARAELKQYNTALADYNKSLSLNPKFAKAWSNRGRLHNNMGKIAEALSDYNKCMELDTSIAEAFNGRGVILVSMGRYEEGLRDLNKAISLMPDYAIAHNNRAGAKFDMGDMTGAFADYNRAIALKPDYEDAYTNKGAAFIKSGKNNEAIDCFNKAIAINPKFFKAYENMAILYYNQKEYEQAMPYFNKVTELNPEYNNGYFYRGNARLFLRDTVGACNDWKRASELGHGQAGVWYEGVCREK